MLGKAPSGGIRVGLVGGVSVPAGVATLSRALRALPTHMSCTPEGDQTEEKNALS
jgi:hypothetical protein